MISKFLYDVDSKGKKVLYGLIEDEEETVLELGSEIDYSFKGDYEEDEIFRNLGGLSFVVFNDNGVKKYLDIDFFNEKAKIQLTEKVAYAAHISDGLIDIILEYLNIDFEYEVIYSGIFEHPTKGTVDSLEKIFKGLFTDSFVQIIKDNVSYFLAKSEDYYLSRNLNDAYKFHKSEIRKILITNKFVDKTTELKTVYFSPYQLLRGVDEFFMLKPFPMMVSKRENNFLIQTSNIPITNNHLLCKSELINGKMKEIGSLLHKEKEDEKGYGLCYNQYLNYTNDIFTLSKDPKDLSLLSKSDISLFASMYTIFSESEVTYLKEQTLIYKYEVEENIYKLSTTTQENFINSNLIKESIYYGFLKHFYSKNLPNINDGVVLLLDGKYLNIEILNDDSFKVSYNTSAYNASVITNEQADILIKILDIDLTKRELNNIWKNGSKYNVNTDNNKYSLVNEYNEILKFIKKQKYKMSMYNQKQIKIESEKGSLEYLRRFYFKAINDSENLFTNILTNNKNIYNILIIESFVNLDLIALNNVCAKLDRKVNVTLLNTCKMGYYPTVSLNSNVNVKGMYRVEFSALPQVLINEIDFILFSRGFTNNDNNFKYMINDVINSQNIIMSNIKHCKLERIEDSFANLFNVVKRKHFLDYSGSEEIIELSRNIFDLEDLSVYNTFSGTYEISDPVVEKEFSYHSIIKVKDKKVIDFYK